MKIRNTKHLKTVVIYLFLFVAVPALAENDDEETLTSIYGDKGNISIATGSRQSLIRAPAVASVITAEEIKASGASNLAQALAGVPGLHISRHQLGHSMLFGFRGDLTYLDSRTLVLINGIPINEVTTGNTGAPQHKISIENISRIEIVRGAGSALYGADAFSGVINIITKNENDVKGTEFGFRLGSFNTKTAWLLKSEKFSDLFATFFVKYETTDNQNSTIQSDFQTELDEIYQTKISRAPGRYNTQISNLDLQTDFQLGDWRMRAGWKAQRQGTGTGIADALDPSSEIPTSDAHFNLSYNKEQYIPNFNVSSVFSWKNAKLNRPEIPYQIFAPGGLGGAFPNGMIGVPSRAEETYGFSVSALYTGWFSHKIRIGAGAKIEDLYKTAELKNFTYLNDKDGIPQLTPLPQIIDATGNEKMIYLMPHKRNVKYFLIQDEWTINKDLSLTFGIRHDRYSDFGGTTNPRLALVWDANYNFTIKGIYNSAFRAPSFAEEYSINNPRDIGNPSIKPEKIHTKEIVFSWGVTQKLQANLNFYSYKMSNIIREVPNDNPLTGKTAQNTGSQSGKGFEFEAEWNPLRTLRLIGNLSVQKLIDDSVGQDAGLAPHKRLYLRADWQFASLWSLNTTMNHVANRKREKGDARPQIADYTVTDFSIRRERAFGNWDARLTIQNLFNSDAREPTLAPGNVRYDLPLPGRGIFLHLNYHI